MNFSIYINNNQPIPFSIEEKSTIKELKKLIFEKLKSEIDSFHICLENFGILDNEDLINTTLSKYKSKTKYHCYSIIIIQTNNIKDIILNDNFCSQNLISSFKGNIIPLSQTGIHIKNKNNMLVCLSCAKHCYNINLEDEKEKFINDKSFICQCYKDNCKFNNCNISILFNKKTAKEKNNFLMDCLKILIKKKANFSLRSEQEKINKLNKQTLQRNFEFEYIISLLEPRINCYKNPILQQKILNIIPKKPENCKNSETYVKFLLKWFKHDFFTWCNKPICSVCKKNNNLKIITYSGKPNEEENKFLAYNTEIYFCENCKNNVRFPRYNNAIKLLETKTGRCSEYSNIFGAILYSVGFKIRIINNFEDHVWNEFYNPEEKKWIHLDSCEQAYDTPLMYEQGWGKIMTFILGLSEYELVEVTPRYIKNWREVSKRRSEKMENKLSVILKNVNDKINNGLNNEQKKIRDEIRINEIKDFESKKNLCNDNYNGNYTIEKLKNCIVRDEEKIGRQSGSLEWRKNRGEC